MKFLNHNAFFKLSLALCIAVCLQACKGKADDAADEDAAVKSQTPVTVTTIGDTSLANYIDVNATSTYLQKNYVKANINGYIEKSNVQPGQYVTKGQLLFVLKTKEAQSIGNHISILDTTFKFTGINKIKASASGYITQLSHQSGDYVQDGEQLAIINEGSSFVFLLQLPYELRSTLANNKSLTLTLPDGEKLNAQVSSLMPAVDTASQAQSVVLRVNNNHPIPENLIARARLIKSEKNNTVSLPKAAVLANETQTEFWVMKLINDTTAIKVPITKGIETSDRTEILSPKFQPKDKIVVTGNYGLADTAKVKIVK
ncbi:efflux RND transporter periplasmic adaptor subunit [Mucilaginibacter jinjuensis]|uniref:Efflux RND transporter periplasmic adaptor subunit n=1 Tax=Mucilaginibacter jinjuensis TaxID=1176721 RepID=A0ABY7T4I7_9SPHI|nr:HlyD family efflux transporter periplasmic adaptor subunit [Mucilaginibacter jinjuensis]WCT11110.1 efflux RND transporter periplasmic adaptor subunit [Mucilaginibacter jinjuensis]